MSNTWGALEWSDGNWSAQNDFTVEVTGLSASSSLGTHSIELNTIEPVTGQVATMSTGQASVELVNNGWGANTWSFSEWGQVGQIVTGQQATLTVASVTPVIDVSFSVSGISSTTSIGSNSVTINQTLTLTGQTLTSSIGNADPAPDAMIVGQSMTTSIGSVTAEGIIEVGWGGDSWGQNQWGELNAPTVPVTGASATITAGTGTTVAAQATVSVTGIESKVNVLGTNFQRYSQDLSQSTYTKRGNATATANYGIAPDGTKTSSLVDNIQGNNTSGGTYSDIYSSYGTNYTTTGQALEPSFWIKRVSGSSTELFFSNPENASQGNWTIDFNSLSTTAWTRIDKNHSAVTVNNTYTSSGSGNAGSHFRVDSSSSVDLSFEIWGIQVEEGTAVSNYKATSASPVDSILLAGTSHVQAVTGVSMTSQIGTEVINIGVPVTGSTATMTAGQSTIDPTYLIGEGWGRDAYGNLGWGVNYSDLPENGLSAYLGLQGTNYHKYSQTFDNAYWQKLRSSVTANSVVAPDGTKTGYTLTQQSGQTLVGKVQVSGGGVPVTSGETYTISIHAKKGTTNFVALSENLIRGSSNTAWFNLNTGAVGAVSPSSGSNITRAISDLGNGWYRCSITGTADATRTGQVGYLVCQSDGSSECTSNTDNIYIWGAQFEKSASASVYKRTEAQPVSSEVSVTADANVTVSGLGMTSTFGVYSVTANADLSITVAEHTMTSSLGSINLVQTTNETATGQSLTSSIGDGEAGLFLVVPVTGSQATISQGNTSLQQSTVEPATGQSLTSSVGTVTEIPAQIVGVSGISMTATIGDEGTASNANVSPTGISLTASTGEVNITPWSEIDIGVVNIWHEVDLAA